jgi:hypothetical protein
MAASQGVSKSTVNAIWRAHQLKPHREKEFQAVARPSVSEEANRCGRAVSESSAAGYGAMRG